jgi:hypothetical protein
MPLPALITPALLTSIRTHPNLPSQTWYFITGVTLSVLNRPEEIPKVFEHAIAHPDRSSGVKDEHADQLRIARRMREALIKVAVIGGLPKV